MSEKSKLDLGVLEEDDEFEEFPVEGTLTLKFCLKDVCMTCS